MNARLGHDFATVRVHTDVQAGNIAQALRAQAYTVGQHVVFAPGRYAPRAITGQDLLAHELVHVLQQRAVGTLSGPLGIDNDERLEREAVSAETNAVSALSTGSAPQIQRKDDGEPQLFPVELAPVSPEELERLKKIGVELPGVSAETWLAIGGKGDRANTELTQRDRDRLAKVKNLAEATSPFAFPQGAQFIIHDTAGRAGPESQRKKYQERAEEARGQLGLGPAAYVATAGAPIVARPRFFDPRRATATEYERRADIASMETREKAFQRIWGATKPSEQEAALSRAFAGLELTPRKSETEPQQKARAIVEERIAPAEIEEEKKAARTQLTSPLPAKRTEPAILTTGAWAVGEICARLQGTPPATATDLAVSDAAAKDMAEGCAELATYFGERVPRVGPAVNVEIAQIAGSQCRTSPTQHPGTKAKPVPLVPLPAPAYTESQYQGVAAMYLQAALQAGRFPEIISHFWRDRGIPGAHCDPRCFDLQHLYDVIADLLGHQRGSTYGQIPKYGTTDGVHNIWWHNVVCGGGPPKASP
jgi:hypothetical protein